MRRTQARVCPLCQLASKPRFPAVSSRPYWKRSSESYRLWRSSTQLWLGDKQTRKAEPYILPRLILDLDAHDSPYVQKIEDLPLEETVNLIRGYDRAGKSEYECDERGAGNSRMGQKGNSKTRSLTREVATTTHRRKVKRSQKTIDALSPFRMTVSPTDLLLYAFRGYPTDLHSEKRLKFPDISKLLDAHNVTPIDNARVGTRSLIYDFTKDGETTLKNVQFKPEREEMISLALSTCLDWYDFRKSVFILASTDAGRNYLRQRGGAIVGCLKRISRFRLDSHSSTYISFNEALRFLNHLSFNMMSNDVDIGERLCNAGIFYSTECASLPALKKYIQIAVDNKYEADVRTRAALQSLCKTLASPVELQPKLQVRKEGIEEMQSFLTGWKTDCGAESGDEKQTCFADFFPEGYFVGTAKFSLYYNYILGLAVIGWKASLHREYLRLENYDPPMFSAGMKGLLFATAYVIANDLSMALTVLEKDPPPPPSESKSRTKSGLPNTMEDNLAHGQNIDVDLTSLEHMPTRSTDFYQGPSSKTMISIMLPIFYRLHGISPGDSKLRELPAAFPQEPKEALEIIERLFDADSLDLHLVTSRTRQIPAESS